MKFRAVITITAAAFFAGSFSIGKRSGAEMPAQRSTIRSDITSQSPPQPNLPATPEDAFRQALRDTGRPFDSREMARLHRITPMPDLMHHPTVSLWAETAPAQLLAWLDRMNAWPRGDANEAKQGILDHLFTSWATIDATAAFTAARAVEPSGCKAAALKGVIGATRRSDPETAAKALLTWQEAGLESGDPLYADQRSPSEDMALVRRLPPSVERAELKSEVMREAVDKHAAEASAIWSAASPEEREEMVRGGFMPAEHHVQANGAQDVDGALFPGAFALAKAAVETVPPARRSWAVHAFWQGSGREWAARDFPAAVQWLKKQSTPIEFLTRLEQIANAGARTQYTAILALVPELESLPQKVAMLRTLSASCPAERRHDLDALVAELPPESRRLIGASADH